MEGVEGVEGMGGMGGVQELGSAVALDLAAWPSMCISTAHTAAVEGQEEVVNAMSQAGIVVETAGAGARSGGGEGRGRGTSRLRVQVGPSQQQQQQQEEQQQQQQQQEEEDAEGYGFSVLDAGDALGPSPRDGSLVKVCGGQVWEEAIARKYIAKACMNSWHVFAGHGRGVLEVSACYVPCPS